MKTIQIEEIKAGGFAMEFFRFGRGERTLVILPGLSVQSVMGLADAVAESYALLADDFTVYVFDRRKDIPPRYSMEDMARDAEAAFEAVGLEDVSIFGASQGGMIAMLLAAGYPQRVRKLILGSTSARIDAEQYRTMEGWTKLAGEGRAEELYLAFGEAIYPQEVFGQFREAFKEAAKTVTKEDLDRFVRLAESLKGFDAAEELEKINCPVLVIGDRADRLLGPEASERIFERLKGQPESELYLYEGYGHAAYDTAPDYRERMLRFLLKERE